ncbi:hypothetical protein [Nonomuraea aridisoli]|uniref:hypothetical protein n=1 Tax=Nonomuraea aridisoli TaxID=2070368 RepID=UPI0011B93C3D|nr:hypothetical protein [Nonomuraea aridisoli]
MPARSRSRPAPSSLRPATTYVTATAATAMASGTRSTHHRPAPYGAATRIHPTGNHLTASCGTTRPGTTPVVSPQASIDRSNARLERLAAALASACEIDRMTAYAMVGRRSGR